MRAIKNIFLARLLRAHPRLFLSILIGFLSYFFLPLRGTLEGVSRAIIGFDLGAAFYIFSALELLFNSSPQQMRRRAMLHDEGKAIVLVLVVVSVLFSLSAIFSDLAEVKSMQGTDKYLRMGLAILTIIFSWFFTHIVFALHYAHDYYFAIQKSRAGGLVFLPTDEEPDYQDFLYFSFILGATAQTADIALASRTMRRTCLLHSIISFFFNTLLLALSVNIASGLI